MNQTKFERVDGDIRRVFHWTLVFTQSGRLRKKHVVLVLLCSCGEKKERLFVVTAVASCLLNMHKKFLFKVSESRCSGSIHTTTDWHLEENVESWRQFKFCVCASKCLSWSLWKTVQDFKVLFILRSVWEIPTRFFWLLGQRAKKIVRQTNDKFHIQNHFRFSSWFKQELCVYCFGNLVIYLGSLKFVSKTYANL